MKFKKVTMITLILTMVLGICLTGCKNNNNNNDDEPPITQAYNDKIKSKVKDLGVGYWKSGDDTNYTIFTLERQNEYLIDENYLNGVMFFASSDYDKVFNTTVTYNDETVWAFSDLSITFNVNGSKMTLNIGDKQYILDKVTLDDIAELRDKLINEQQTNENIEDNNVVNNEIEITTSNSENDSNNTNTTNN